jgi:hypothetical protein
VSFYRRGEFHRGERSFQKGVHALVEGFLTTGVVGGERHNGHSGQAGLAPQVGQDAESVLVPEGQIEQHQTDVVCSCRLQPPTAPVGAVVPVDLTEFVLTTTVTAAGRRANAPLQGRIKVISL